MALTTLVGESVASLAKEGADAAVGSTTKEHISSIGPQVQLGDATTTSSSNIALALAAQADTSLAVSGNFMDTESVLDVDAVTNFTNFPV